MPTDDSAKSVGRRLKIARLAAGHGNRAAFADSIGLRGHTLWRYERGDMKPGLDVAVILARVLRVSMEWIATGKGKGPRARVQKKEPELLRATGTG
jgi:DNA-binding XRE family transcriptional regulator